MADPWGVDYALTADFTAVGADGVSGSTMTSTGNSYAGFAGGEAKLLVQSGMSSANASRYLEFTLTPDDVEEEWAITSLFLRSRRRAGSANAGWWLLSSLDGYTEILANRANDGTEASDTVDLTTLGTLVGPITFRIYAYAITGAGNGVYLWDLQLDGTYGPDDP